LEKKQDDAQDLVSLVTVKRRLTESSSKMPTSLEMPSKGNVEIWPRRETSSKQPRAGNVKYWKRRVLLNKPVLYIVLLKRTTVEAELAITRHFKSLSIT
jgi:hypothetical protein